MSGISKKDAARYERLREIGCIACRIAGYINPCGPTEIHHIVDKGYRRLSGGNAATIPLGVWHHRGQPFIDRTGAWMRVKFGPSMFHDSRTFREVYGTQRELLDKVNFELVVA